MADPEEEKKLDTITPEEEKPEEAPDKETPDAPEKEELNLVDLFLKGEEDNFMAFEKKVGDLATEIVARYVNTPAVMKGEQTPGEPEKKPKEKPNDKPEEDK